MALTIQGKVSDAMGQAFTGTEDMSSAIHATAVAGAAICAALPVGADVIALRSAECAMVVCIASRFGEKLTKSAAKGLMASGFAQLVGETVALGIIEALDVTNPAAAYAVKASVAVSLIEAVGHAALKHYEKRTFCPDAGITVFDGMCAVGAASDIIRVANTASEYVSAKTASTETAQAMTVQSPVGLCERSAVTGSSAISFGASNKDGFVGGKSNQTLAKDTIKSKSQGFDTVARMEKKDFEKAQKELYTKKLELKHPGWTENKIKDEARKSAEKDASNLWKKASH